MGELTGYVSLQVGHAQMLKGGVIMDVMNPEQAKIAEAAGACAGEILTHLANKHIALHGSIVGWCAQEAQRRSRGCLWKRTLLFFRVPSSVIGLQSKASVGHS